MATHDKRNVKRITDAAVVAFTCGKVESGDRKGQRKDQDILWDIDIKGFGMRLSSRTGTRSYLFRYRRPSNWKEVYYDLGRHTGDGDAEAARANARAAFRLVEDGKDPEEEERKYHEAQAAANEAEKARTKVDLALAVTLRETMEEYLATRRHRKYGTRLRPDSQARLRGSVERYLADWLDRPIVTTATPDACAARFARITKNNGKTAANMTMQYLRALCNHAARMSRGPDGVPRLFPANPVTLMIENIGNLNPKTARHGRIPKDRIGAVWNELRRLAAGHNREDVRTAADWLSVVMLTGMRLTESAALMKANVNLKARTLHIPGECDALPGFYGTKNHNSLTLPLSAPLEDVLEKRAAATKPNPKRPHEHLLCFPSARGTKQPFNKDGRATLIMLSGVAGFHLSTHDLRRTYEDVMRYAKVDPDERRLILNHISGDVHQISYSNSRDPESLRDAMDAAAAWVMEQARIADSSNVIPFPLKGPAIAQMAGL